MGSRNRHPPVKSEDRVYQNAGNPELLDLLGDEVHLVLDVGCGAGDNAEILRTRHPGIEVHGITRSLQESEMAKRRMKECWVADLENGLPPQASLHIYDAIIFSHVLEHLRDPAEIVRQASLLLRKGGTCLIAVPNVLAWAQRAKFLKGSFEYESAGIMDETHLRFFTYRTAPVNLLSKSPDLAVTHVSASGSVPLWLLRRHVLPKTASSLLDKIGCRFFPNLFGYQVLVSAIKTA